eukprot:557219-Ditylum_brightwellii.AAC.1
MWAGPESDDIDDIDDYDDLLDEDPDIIKLQYDSLGIHPVKSVEENIFNFDSPTNTNTVSIPPASPRSTPLKPRRA